MRPASPKQELLSYEFKGWLQWVGRGHSRTPWCLACTQSHSVHVDIVVPFQVTGERLMPFPCHLVEFFKIVLRRPRCRWCSPPLHPAPKTPWRHLWSAGTKKTSNPTNCSLLLGIIVDMGLSLVMVHSIFRLEPRNRFPCWKGLSIHEDLKIQIDETNRHVVTRATTTFKSSPAMALTGAPVKKAPPSATCAPQIWSPSTSGFDSQLLHYLGRRRSACRWSKRCRTHSNHTQGSPKDCC